MRSKNSLLCIISLCIVLTACSSPSAEFGKNKNVSIVIKEIDNIGEVDYNSDDVLNKIEADYQALSEEEKQEVSNYNDFEEAKNEHREKVKEYLQREAREKALALVRERIKQSLKSPKSYNEYSCEVQDAIIIDGLDKCVVAIKIRYGATNSFGAEVTDTISAYVNCSYDIDKKSMKTESVFIR